MKLSMSISTLAVLLAAAVTAAHAAEAPAATGGAVAEACKQDVQTLCPGVQPGEGRIMACLKGKRSQVSAGCKEAVKAQRKSKDKSAP